MAKYFSISPLEINKMELSEIVKIHASIIQNTEKEFYEMLAMENKK